MPLRDHSSVTDPGFQKGEGVLMSSFQINSVLTEFYFKMIILKQIRSGAGPYAPSKFAVESKSKFWSMLNSLNYDNVL